MLRIHLPPISIKVVVICSACIGISLLLHNVVNNTMVQLSFKRKYSYIIGLEGLDNSTVQLSLLSTTSGEQKDMLTPKATNISTIITKHEYASWKPHTNTSGDEMTDIAIGMGITSKKIYLKGVDGFLERMPLFRELLPSFCNTASKGYRYHFYFGYDNSDMFFTNETMIDLWTDKFSALTKKKCQHLGDIDAHLIQCNHSGRPAWAQNDAMIAAYKDGHDFFYRVNDDTIMVSENWTHIFIDELNKMKPPLVGVVGPKHFGGNTYILTYDFVHRTHIDIFGYYYPREFPWWYADTWITDVYKPGRSKKVNIVKLKHSMSLSRRYSMIRSTNSFIAGVCAKSRIRLKEYLKGLVP